MDLNRHHRPTRPIRSERSWVNAPATRRYRKRTWTKAIFKIILAVFLLVGIIGFVYLAWIYNNLPDPSTIAQRTVAQSTKIYDRTGTILLYEIHGDRRRTSIDLSQIPPNIIRATIVTEDKDFYSHQGFDIKGIIRSVVMDIMHLSKVQGGSTITQQLVKNAMYDSKKTFDRKIRELIFAYQIEKRFSKDQILKMYLNEIPYGKSAYGIEAAAQTYFGKNAKDLTLAQGAVLVALPKAPSYYSPFGTHRDDLIARAHFVIKQLRTNNYINDQEAEAAINEKLIFAPPREQIIAPHFVFYVREQLEQTYGEQIVGEGGLKIITTLDATKQALAEKAVQGGVEKILKYNATNAALVSLDPKTGQILAMVGSKDYFDVANDGNVNIILRPLQPGSSFKPIVYATAFKRGFTPETVLYDVVTTFKNYPTDYTPHNYNLKENGPVTIRKALAGSLNIPAVKTLYLAGVNNVLDFAQSLGYTTLSDRSRFGLSLVLGGGEVKPLEHTNAFAVFSQEGVWHKPAGILKVIDANGATLQEWKDQSREVVAPQICRQISSILSDNSAREFIFGAKNSLILSDRPVAAKTGTTNDYRDAWTIGYTPSVVTGVWVGNNDHTAMKKGSDGSVLAAPIWNAYMTAVTKGTPVERFNPPPINSATKPVLRGEAGGVTITVKIDRASGKLATDQTPLSFVENKDYKEIHDILYYVNKDDPDGPLPTDPKIDPQFNNWEGAVQKWGKAQKIPIPPTEYDDLHVEANVPTLSVSGVNDNASINSSALALTFESTSLRGVHRIEALVDGKLLNTFIDSPIPPILSGTINLSEVNNGTHTLTIRAADDIDNIKELNFNINVNK